ncbi:MAG TPA: hypothetical protein VJ111_07465 [Chitinophagaceae bacterium]|nr:hypothetical protein [Chitinophagaceae bacterium]
MQENKFEKGVQQQMEEFRIRPSDAVWEKIEEELRKKKKRRVVFFFFLLAGLSLLGYSGYFLFNNSKQNLVQQNTNRPDKDKSIKDNRLLQDKENSIGGTFPSKKEKQLSPDREKNSPAKEKINSTGTNDFVLNDKEIVKEKNVVVKSEDGKSIKKKTNKTLPLEIKSKDKTADIAVINKNSLETRDNQSLQKKDRDVPVINKTGIPGSVIAKTNLVDEKQLPVVEENPQAKKDSIPVKIAANKEPTPAATKKKKWPSKINWGIDLSVGIAGNREDIFSFSNSQKSLVADYLSSPATNFNGGSPGIVYSPSSVQPGPAFRAGLVAEMKISPKSSISSGLGYAYFSNTIQVGTRSTAVPLYSIALQSARVSSLYRGFPQKEYTNRYHFIQLPVQYQLQLNKGVKLPILWNIGASAGYLFATNGLAYDAMAGGIYYRNDEAFNKIHFNLNTGFSFRFGNKSNIHWSLGPELSLGMNKLMKGDYVKQQYLLYGGLTGRIIFAKKNK